tara:strand:- start:101 stop:472 length:372 start_codon:yes stop_codon:yes gene_type:complete
MSSSIFDDDNDNVPKEGTGKKKEDMDVLREIHDEDRPSTRKRRKLMNDPILSPERPQAQLDKEREAATTTAKELFKKGGKKKRKTRKKTRKKRKKKKRKTKKRRKRKKRKTKKRYRNQRGCKR